MKYIKYIVLIAIVITVVQLLQKDSLSTRDELEKYLPKGVYIEKVHSEPLASNGDYIFLAKIKNVSPEQFTEIASHNELQQSFSKNDLLGMKFSNVVSWWKDPEGAMLETLCGKQGANFRTWMYYDDGDCFYADKGW